MRTITFIRPEYNKYILLAEKRDEVGKTIIITKILVVNEGGKKRNEMNLF